MWIQSYYHVRRWRCSFSWLISMNQFLYYFLIVDNSTHLGAVTRMEGLTHLQASQRGYRAHVMKTYGRTVEITNSTDLFTLHRWFFWKQQQKKVNLEELDTRITNSIEETMVLEEEVCDVEEYRTVLSEKTTFLQDFISSANMTSPVPLMSSPPSQFHRVTCHKRNSPYSSSKKRVASRISNPTSTSTRCTDWGWNKECEWECTSH